MRGPRMLPGMVSETVTVTVPTGSSPDILWRYTTTGQNAVWYMNGATLIGTAMLPTEGDLNWKIVGVK